MKSEHKVSKDRIEKLINISFPFSGLPEEVQVMEMLDVIPSYLEEKHLKIDKWKKDYVVCYIEKHPDDYE